MNGKSKNLVTAQSHGARYLSWSAGIPKMGSADRGKAQQAKKEPFLLTLSLHRLPAGVTLIKGVAQGLD